jgi:hypothetical protein
MSDKDIYLFTLTSNMTKLFLKFNRREKKLACIYFMYIREMCFCWTLIPIGFFPYRLALYMSSFDSKGHGNYWHHFESVILSLSSSLLAFHIFIISSETKGPNFVEIIMLDRLCLSVTLWQVGGFLWVCRFPPPIKFTSTILTEILLKV